MIDQKENKIKRRLIYGDKREKRRVKKEKGCDQGVCMKSVGSIYIAQCEKLFCVYVHLLTQV